MSGIAAARIDPLAAAIEVEAAARKVESYLLQRGAAEHRFAALAHEAVKLLVVELARELASGAESG